MKIKFVICAVAALFVFSGASVWEGSAAIAASGALPHTGFYVATNSFPQNTAVDIVNLENGRRIQAVVISRLESPGLLALVSMESAAALGLAQYGIGRISIAQPSGSVAQGGPAAGSPAAQASAVFVGAALPTQPPAAQDPVPTQQVIITQPPAQVPAPAQPQAAFPPDPIQEPIAEEPYAAFPPAQIQEPMAEEPQVAFPPDPIQEPIAEEPQVAVQPEILQWQDAPAQDAQEPIAQEPQVAVQPLIQIQEAPAPIQEPIAEEPQAAVQPLIQQQAPIQEPIAEPPVAEAQEPEAQPSELPDWFANLEHFDLRLRPAEMRPPIIPAYTINPDDIIPGITRDPQAAAGDGEPDFAAEPQCTGYIAQAPVQVAPAQFVAPPAQNQEPPPPNDGGQFPLLNRHLVSSLESGRFYVQIGAFTREEAVENEIRRIGGDYPVAVFNAGSSENPVFRILLGPLNQGEGGALMQRFRSIGFSDAFVRHAP